MELRCPRCAARAQVNEAMFKAVGAFRCPSCRAPMEACDPDPEEISTPVPVRQAGPWDAIPPGAGAGEIPFRFIGTAQAYFRIWIVNLALTIVTLGIYSAWAKVRRKRFFYGHTLLDGTGFEYLGNPVKILLGRLLFVGVFAALGVASRFEPVRVEQGSNLLFLVLLPWLLIKSRAFNLRNSAYRNLRFDFRGRYDKAFRLFLLYPVLVFLSLGLLMPRWLRAQQAFWVQHSRYGAAFGTFHAEARLFTRLFFHLSLLVLLFLGLIVAGATLLERLPPAPWGNASDLSAFLPLLAGYLPLLLLYSYTQAALFRLMWNHTGLGEARFVCRLNPWYMVWITVGNTLLILLSVGLLTPWAKVRAARVRLASLALIPGAAGLEGFIAARTQEVGAVGEEIGDFFDVDIGL